jgi:hypothetical protein
MLPLSDGLHPRRFLIVNVALIAANFAVWILYELIRQPEVRRRQDGTRGARRAGRACPGGSSSPRRGIGLAMTRVTVPL